MLGQTVAKAWQDRILGLSAEAAFWQILSVPPLLIGLLGTLGYLGDVIGDSSVRQIEERLLTAAAEVLTPNVVDTLVAPTLSDILAGGRLDVVSVGFLLSLWAGSSATATFMNTIVIAYDQRDVRGPVRTRLKALWLFIVGMGVAVVTLPLLVLGRAVLVSLLPDDWQATATLLVDAVYWPVVLIGLLLALTSFYHVVLPNRLPWRRHLPGAALALTFFLVAALLLRAYVATSSPRRCRTARWRPRSASCCSASSSAWRCCWAPSSTPPSRPAGRRRCAATTGGGGSAGRPSSERGPQARPVTSRSSGPHRGQLPSPETWSP